MIRSITITINVLILISLPDIYLYGHTQKEGLITVLILSGQNNHEWQKTTPLLAKTFEDSKLFKITATDKPDTLTFNYLHNFQVIVSNWNTWPDNKLRMTNQWENDFIKYVQEGGGVVTIHAGASSFYDWNIYHKIGIGRWGKETSHGTPTKGHVYGFDQNHPVTKGMSDFYTMDEIWEKCDVVPGAKILASVKAISGEDGHSIDMPAVFTNQTGKGRSFYTILGHDERAMLNEGFQTLLLRAAQWCAGKEVTAIIPDELKKLKNEGKDQLGWNETDTTLSLSNNSEILWQFNYNNHFGKTYFHPLTVNHSDLTCVSPPDHPWHLGLWFSWKFVNKVNYWEYLNDFNSEKTGYRSEGVTELKKIDISKNPDFSSVIKMKLNYHPIKGEPVMTEDRILKISAPFKDGSYYIDEEHLFTALEDSVILDRTPITGETDGQSWGGYSGLSVRFNQSYTSPELISPGENTNCPKCDWLYMGFNTLTNKKTGMAILVNTRYSTNSLKWYVIKDLNIPFYYYSPAVLFEKNIVLKKGEGLILKYRIWILPGIPTKEQLQEKYDQYINTNH